MGVIARRVGLVAVGVLALAGCTSALPDVPTPSHSTSAAAPAVAASIPPPAVVDAVKRAQSEGKITGTVQWVTTSTMKAQAITRTGSGAADVPIYAVQMRGWFVLGSAPRPPGATSPTGSVLVVFVPMGDDSAGGGGAMLSNSPVDLSAYGDVRTYKPA